MGKSTIGVGGWTEEATTGMKGVAAGGGTQMMLDTSGDVWGKATTSINSSGWAEEITSGQAAVAAG